MTITKITLQNIFDAAWQAFIVEGKPPAVDSVGCVYLDEKGNKCAIGLCIPDGHPAQEFLGSFGSLTQDFPYLFECGGLSYDKLNEFQLGLHDSLIAGRDWSVDRNVRRKEYLIIARQYGLKAPIQEESCENN